ncbi:tetratricopeptide repeat protein [Bifidobacterium psychraerophilum]|jgi:putative thioredoxin|uniref:tetratricopeptide repeat protein n=1 Tax=Bifidobacterium psychraerophilum TaxID=218140 RepID=UPI0023F2FA0E|nr:tetratricopeptide repeat protein [Bifidobacterium psychraerophilum]MCI1659680.1 tetratricopeptide repeat protein [Bifidobacterium psychraerophilum]MCI1805540.1 tetratricopeptide repeat protein [Bifidobacterium psychraerophilum]MCI2176076.1 tetratricopeptide repeat protein [Bifidobacterium psychraerophilum]MCI2182676.1 tetratricopeptide repeat protein [Bifidobacterium psychraerophilum]
MATGNQQFQPGVSLAGAVDLGAIKHQVDAEPGQQGGAPAAGGYVIDTSSAGFQAVMQTSATFPILLLLWTPGDDRLFPLAKALGDAVNAQEGKVQLARIDIAAEPEIAQAFRVQGAPALFALIGGRPMPVLQGLPSAEELTQLTDELIPQVITLAHQSGITGTAPYQEGTPSASDQEGDADAPASEPAVPPAHEQANRLAQEGDFEGAVAAYDQVLQADPSDALAARERAKALLLARSAQLDVRVVRQQAADRPDDVESQLAVADIDMIGGQIADAFGRLLDYLAGHRDQMEPVRKRLLEFFLIPEANDPRLKNARQRLATLMY